MKEKSYKQKDSFNVCQLLFPLEEIVKIDHQGDKIEDR
jgi:hypothetical protein